MDNSLTISDVIKSDHEKINKFYKNYLICQGNIDDEQQWSNQFQQELIRHITAEELILYPAYEKYLHIEGKKIIDQGQHEHQYMKKLLFFLEITSITDPQYRFTFDQIIKIFNEHIQREENNNLSKLENILTPHLSKLLAQSFQHTKNSSHLKVYPTSSINPPL